MDARAVADAIAKAARRQPPSVDDQGAALPCGMAGVELVRLAGHHDHRGSLTAFLDPRRPFWREPIVYGYAITIRPGRIKGWGMHRLQHDRYWLPSGQLRVVLYDDREGSATRGRFEQFHFTDASPGLLRIPPGVWHADQNWGDRDAVILNFPTVAYDAANPDKYRIDPHAGVIPFDWKLADG
jgi:dTDP-4-dehydrorhamnose 3,5-epimerase